MKETNFSYIDHLIFGAPDLQAGVEFIEKKLAVKFNAGGQHPDFGTHNALFKLSEYTYFEVIAPDPSLAALNQPLWMGLAQLRSPRLIWWAAKADQLNRKRQIRFHNLN